MEEGKGEFLLLEAKEEEQEDCLLVKEEEEGKGEFLLLEEGEQEDFLLVKEKEEEKRRNLEAGQKAQKGEVNTQEVIEVGSWVPIGENLIPTLPERLVEGWERRDKEVS